MAERPPTKRKKNTDQSRKTGARKPGKVAKAARAAKRAPSPEGAEAGSQSGSEASSSDQALELTAELLAQFHEVRAERDSLRDRLSDAEKTISALEAQQSRAVNRIDWVLDSLHNVVDQKS